MSTKFLVYISMALQSFYIWGALFFLLLICNTAHSGELHFEKVLDKAMENAIELKISYADEKVANVAKLESTSKFYPQLYFRINTDYTEDLSKNPTGIFINNKFYPDSTAWNSSATLGFQYDFFNSLTDFNAYRYASRNFIAQKYQTKANRRNLAVSIVGIYERILVYYYNVMYFSELAKYALELYNVQKRLYDAGFAGKQLYYLAAARASDYQIQKLDSEKYLLESLEELSYYTDDNYSITDIPQDFITNIYNYTVPDYTSYPEYKNALIRLEQKELEKSIAIGGLLPRFAFYGSYNLYGKDRNAYDKVISALEQTNYTLGVGIVWNFFDTSTFLGKFQRINMEKNKLELEKLQIIKKINLENSRLINAKEYLERSNEESKISLDASTNIFTFNEALRNVNLTGAADILTQQLDTIEKLQEQKSIAIRFAAEVKRLEVINKYID